MSTSENSKIPLDKNKENIAEALQIFKRPKNSNITKKIKKFGNKRQYKKFSKEQLNILINSFQKNHYPSKDEMNSLAIEIQEPFLKIENWMKHQRKQKVKTGLMKYIKKKAFSQNEKEILMKEFIQCSRPSNSKMKEIAELFNCQVVNIKHWFGYKRKLSYKINKGTFLSEKQKEESKVLKEKYKNIFSPKIETPMLNQNYLNPFLSNQSINNAYNINTNPYLFGSSQNLQWINLNLLLLENLKMEIGKIIFNEIIKFHFQFLIFNQMKNIMNFNGQT